MTLLLAPKGLDVKLKIKKKAACYHSKGYASTETYFFSLIYFKYSELYAVNSKRTFIKDITAVAKAASSDLH